MRKTKNRYRDSLRQPEEQQTRVPEEVRGAYSDLQQDMLAALSLLSPEGKTVDLRDAFTRAAEGTEPEALSPEIDASCAWLNALSQSSICSKITLIIWRGGAGGSESSISVYPCSTKSSSIWLWNKTKVSAQSMAVLTSKGRRRIVRATSVRLPTNEEDRQWRHHGDPRTSYQ